MDKRIKLEIVQKELRDILRIIDMNLSKEELRKIDQDLILDKLRNVYDEMQSAGTHGVNERVDDKNEYHQQIPSIIDDVLENRNQTDSKVEKALEELIEEKEVKEKVEELPQNETKSEKSKVVVVKSKTAKEEQEKVELEPEKIKKRSSEKHQEEQEPEADFSENIVHKTYDHDEVKTIADQFQDDTKPSLNEILANKQKARDLASQYSDKPIENLKASISINDKIWFIKELFDGDTDLYNKTLHELNAMSDLDQALSYLNQNFEWDQQKDSFQSFLALIFRRFLPEEIQS